MLCCALQAPCSVFPAPMLLCRLATLLNMHQSCSQGCVMSVCACTLQLELSFSQMPRHSRQGQGTPRAGAVGLR